MKNEPLIIIANKLNYLRIEQKLKQEDLCLKLNIKRATYANWESARVEIPLEKLDLIANFYNIGIDYLFNFYTEKSDIEYKPMNFNKLSENLKNFKEKNHLKLESLAIDAGTTVSTIWAYLNDKNKILTTYLYNICQKNNLSADYLLGKVDNPIYLD
ncbi:MAG: helix-turn-helix transcriptional regulator [Bacilli bacterium]|jgi:transcriptional regulator with XRE-family HTH domain|nr:helix-turn-helix transcriptional regulator [Bacilli bacterium]